MELSQMLCLLFTNHTLPTTPFQRKTSPKSRQIAANFGLARFVFSPFLRTPPAFSTILPFYLADGLCFLQAQLSAFCREIARKKHLFTIACTFFHAEKKAINIQFAMRIYAKRLAISSIQPCIQQQNALRLAANCTAFSGKTQRILRHIARCFAANSRVFAAKSILLCSRFALTCTK